MSVCIAIKDKDRIYMGCDSQVTMGAGKHTLKSVNNFKIWKVEGADNCLMGGVGRMRDICFTRVATDIVPLRSIMANEIDYATVVQTVVPAIWNNLISYSCYDEEVFTKGDGIESQFLLALGGNLYLIMGDGCVEEIEDYTAIGSGDDLALGSLKTTGDSNFTPEERIAVAIDAAAHGNTYVSNPIIIADTKTEGFAIYGEDQEKISSDHLEEIKPVEPAKPAEPKKKKKTDKKSV